MKHTLERGVRTFLTALLCIMCAQANMLRTKFEYIFTEMIHSVYKYNPIINCHGVQSDYERLNLARQKGEMPIKVKESL